MTKNKTISFGSTTAETMLDAISEVRHEITRINQAAGETVFNPAATDYLEWLRDMIEQKLGR